jgi:hypothetical protein
MGASSAALRLRLRFVKPLTRVSLREFSPVLLTDAGQFGSSGSVVGKLVVLRSSYSTTSLGP